MDWRLANDVYMEAHNTQGGNRNNPLWGVGAMSGLYEDGLVDLPFGDEPARELMGVLARQMVRFTDNAMTMKRQNRKTDLLMASWFPQKAIRRFRAEHRAEESGLDEFSFVGFEETDWSEVPW